MNCSHRLHKGQARFCKPNSLFPFNERKNAFVLFPLPFTVYGHSLRFSTFQSQPAVNNKYECIKNHWITCIFTEYWEWLSLMNDHNFNLLPNTFITIMDSDFWYLLIRGGNLQNREDKFGFTLVRVNNTFTRYRVCG